MGNRVAVFDLGSNAFKLLVAELEPNNNHFSILHQEQEGVKLASKGINQKKITEEARIRALETIARFKVTAERFGANNFICTGTSAFRDAKNGPLLVDEIRERFHLDVEIISGEREASLIHKGVKSAYDFTEQPDMICDIGGGSLEVVIANNQKLLFQKSYDLGIRRVMEKLSLPDPLTQDDAERIETFFTKELEELTQKIEKFQPQVLIGTSGSFETISTLIREKKQRPLKTEGAAAFRLSRKKIDALYDQITLMEENERKNIPGMDLIRVDLIAVAIVFIRHIIKKYKFVKVVYSQYALKEGLIFEASNSAKL